MKPGHMHLTVRDLEQALAWFERVLDLKPRYRDERMATLPFGDISLIIDAGDLDSEATIAFESDDCDADFQQLVARGAVVLASPTKQPWGNIRSAYLEGPGKLTIELEQVTDS